MVLIQLTFSKLCLFSEKYKPNDVKLKFILEHIAK